MAMRVRTIIITVVLLALCAAPRAHAENPHGPFTVRGVCEATGNAGPECGETERPKWPSPNFEADCRRDRIIVHVDEKAKGDWPTGFELPGVQVVPPRDGERRFVIINDVDKAARTRLEKMLRDWRKCDAYYQCLADRDAGKVKHCYANDKRWRDIYSGEL